MATSRGRSEVDAFFDAAPGKLTNILRGAARAGANVVADEIKARTISDDVRENVRIRTQKGDGQILVKIDVKPGWARSVATWLEYGTAPHFISVDASQRTGLGIRRINEHAKGGSLVINGQFVGSTVFHKGARAHPFMRVSLDHKEGEAIAAAQRYIDKRVSRGGIVTSAEPDDDGA